MFKEKSERKGITLGLDAQDTEGVAIEADVRKFKQILFNLLANSMKFTPAGGSVRVRTRRIEAAREAGAQRKTAGVEIAVEDTGIGIRPEDRDKLFQPFSQIESPDARSQEGTGLGLMLSQKLIALHGGCIRVKSEYGKGSVFTVSLPLHPALKECDWEGAA